MYSKSRDPWNLLELLPLDPDFTISSRVDVNLMIWMIKVDGFVIDFRNAPRDFHVMASEQGLIPNIPVDRPDE